MRLGLVAALSLALVTLFAASIATAQSMRSMQWSYQGPIGGKHCVQWLEGSDPHTWHDNHLCTDVDFGFRWSFQGPISGIRCTQILEPSDPHTWDDNYFCVPWNFPVALMWSYQGPIGGVPCVQIIEPSDPHTWRDNYLCYVLY